MVSFCDFRRMPEECLGYVCSLTNSHELTHDRLPMNLSATVDKASLNYLK
jgi:hypothetical protein